MTTTTAQEEAPSFIAKLEARVAAIDSLLCVGLDPHSSELFPNGLDGVSEEFHAQAAFTFCKTIIDETLPFAACYKPNAAFFEAIGPTHGMATLARLLKTCIPNDIPILLDVKRGDIGTTAEAYATACYDHLGADAVTLSPLMGWDSISPFVTEQYATKGAFLLCKTSNPGSNDLLALSCCGSNNMTLYECIAQLASTWSANHPESCLGLVVGATDSVAMAQVRNMAGQSTWILAPGVGAQGGNLMEACRAGLNAQGTGLLIPVSRGISKALNPGMAAKELVHMIQLARREVINKQTSRSESDEPMTMAKIQNYQKEFIEFSLSQGVLKFGSFVLKSGRTSPYFFNAGLFATGASLFRLGKAYASAIMASTELVKDGKVIFDVVFGPAYKGISIGAVVCAALYSDFGVDTCFAYNRKEAKDHGEGGQLVGASMYQKRVLVVDDVITGGTAIRESYDMLTLIGAVPMGVVIALDRAEKRALDDPISAVQAVVRDMNIPVVSIVNMPQLQLYLEQSPDFDEDVLTSVSEYRAQYGV